MNVFKQITDKLMRRKDQVSTQRNKSKRMNTQNQAAIMQSRNSPYVPIEVVLGIIKICAANQEIERCHALDVRDPNSSPPELKKFIVLALDHNAEQFESIVPKIHNMLEQKRVARDYLIATSDRFPAIFDKPEYAVYIRKSN